MKTTPWLTIVVIFYNNQREAERTLYTLSSAYQKEIIDNEYQVIAIDNNSPRPLKKSEVTKFGENFNYHFFETDLPSPCAALNWGIKQAKTPYVMCLIDGAHMLSPRVLIETKSVLSAFPNAFVYTVPFHLGETLQNESMLRGYNQEVEDELLKSVNWKENGYGLFFISEVKNANHSFFTAVNESNCFTISKEKILEKGGFDERFVSIGGGLTNLDIFNQLVSDEDMKSVALVGEASFHQFHGGVSTNIERKEHPIGMFKEEYRNIKGENYGRSPYTPHYWGAFRQELVEYMPVSSYREVLRLARKMANNNMTDSAIDMLSSMRAFQKQHPFYYNVLGLCYERKKSWSEALDAYIKSHKLGANEHVTLKVTSILVKLGEYVKALKYLEMEDEYVFDKPRVLLKKAQVYSILKKTEKSNEAFHKAFKILIGPTVFFPIAYIEALRFCLGRKRLIAAQQIVDKAIEYFPEEYLFKNFVVKIYLERKEVKRAEKILLKVLEEVAPKHRAVFYLSLCDCYKMQNEKDKALKILEKAKKEFPDYQKFHNLIQEIKNNKSTD